MLYSFCAEANCSDGRLPQGGLVTDAEGGFFGATAAGGGTGCDGTGCGTVFRLAADGTETVLYAFIGGADGLGPLGNLIMRHGYLLGATGAGGKPGCGDGCGTVFEVKK